MDVLVGRISFAQSLFNIKSTVRFGQNIVDILHNNEDEYKEIFVHSFSAGGLMWGLAQKLMKRVRSSLSLKIIQTYFFSLRTWKNMVKCRAVLLDKFGIQ